MVTGTMLKEMRLRKGQTTRQASKLIGVSQPTVSRWESSGISERRQADADELYKRLSAMPDDPKVFQTFENRVRRQKKKTTRQIVTHPPNGKEIKMLREAYGYSQEILGDMIGISPQLLSHIENGYYEPAPDVLENICEVFGIKTGQEQCAAVRTGSGARF